MKKYTKPSMDTLDVKFTEHGTALLTNIDEIRTDKKGNYWVSFSGEGEAQKTNGEMEE